MYFLIPFSGPEIVNCRGCKISWRKGKNATLRPVKKLRNGEVVSKWAKRNSFFNFFTPPSMTSVASLASGNESFLDARKTALMNAHFEIGMLLKTTFVPKAVLFFLAEVDGDGEAVVSTRGYLDYLK